MMFRNKSINEIQNLKLACISVVFLALSTLLSAGQVHSKNQSQTKAKDKEESLPSNFDQDKSDKFSLKKWRSLTDDGIATLEKKNLQSAEQFFQAAVREASKAPTMSPYMIDSLVHTAEVYRLSGRKAEAKECFEQALMLVKALVADKCPLCEETKESVPILYAPHSEELEAWVKDKSARLGDFKSVTKPKDRPLWYCNQCDKEY